MSNVCYLWAHIKMTVFLDNQFMLDLAGLNWSRFNVNLGPKVGGQNGKKEIFS